MDSNTKSKENVTREEFEQLVSKLRKSEDEKMKIMRDHGNLMKEINKRMHVHLEEIRLLKDVNQKLQRDIQELRDLCCYLDDDRQKCRKLAREWQRFGRYTATVMRNEMTTYQEKLSTLEFKQDELTRENIELRELCIYLDRQRHHMQEISSCGNCTSQQNAGSNAVLNGKENGHDRSRDEKLEARLQDLGNNIANMKDVQVNGKQKESVKKRVSFNFPEEFDTDSDSTSDSRSRELRPPPLIPQQNGVKNHSHHGILRNGVSSSLRKKASKPFPENGHMTPEVMTQAMKVLEIHEKLEHPGPMLDDGKLDNTEVAVLKEMCNVVWRKLSTEDQNKNVVNGTNEDDEIFEDLL